MDVRDTTAIVTGGASGLGAATARRLAAAGSTPIVVDLDGDLGEAVAKETGGTFVRADVASPDDMAVAVAAAADRGPLRVLVNCAGIGLAERTLRRDGTPHDLAGFERILRVNLVGTFNGIRLAAAAMAQLPELGDGERGAILNTASVAAFDGQIGQVAYAASKGGILGLTLPAARDLSSIGVRVNTIAPGLIDTPIYGTGGASSTLKDELAEKVLFPRRLGVAEEFASLALEAITNSYLNGETIRLDGGIRMPPR